jgi:hypothetical protein
MRQYMNMLREQNAALLLFKSGGTSNYHRCVKS